MKSSNAPRAPRPGKVVREYIECEFLESGRNGSRIPSVEQIAERLGASTSTVRYVVKKLIEEGRLEALQGRGTFIRQQSSSVSLTLGCNLMKLSGSKGGHLNWSETIYWGAVRQAAAMERPISMLPVWEGLPKNMPDNIDGRCKNLLDWMDHVDLLMLYPLRSEHQRNFDYWKESEKLVRAYEDAGKPVVWVNPPRLNIPYNFVSCDYYDIACRIGKVWWKTGRRKVLFISSLGLGQSISDQLYLNGLINGMHCFDDPNVELRVEVASSISHDSGYSVVNGIAGSFTPDAILCASDLVASGVIEALQAKGLNIPSDVSLISGTGLYDTVIKQPRLTHIQQPMEKIGAEAVRMLVKRYQTNNSMMPGVFLPASFFPGATIRAEENKLLSAESL